MQTVPQSGGVQPHRKQGGTYHHAIAGCNACCCCNHTLTLQATYLLSMQLLVALGVSPVTGSVL